MSVMEASLVKADTDSDGLSDSLYPTDIEVKVEPGDLSVNTDKDEGIAEVKTEPGFDGGPDNHYPTGEYCRSSTHRTTERKYMRTHTGGKPFQCKTCNSSFAQRCALTSHMWTHVEEKLFQCKICNKNMAKEEIQIEKITNL
ncbi:zinc finger protein 771-like isoform X2 [Watersipora subatra]|uniref:zinc finger protein 771-like isoform X2 n=1 Tax=Watersipora subatra TaxID=2589382 RepID=UPI00355C5041